MAGHTAQKRSECKAHAVSLLPDVKAHCFPLLQLATMRSIEAAPAAADVCFQWPCADGGLRNWRYPRWRMIAYEVDFRGWGSNGLLIVLQFEKNATYL